jgi:hypothetical protein
MSDLFARGMAASYRAGRQHIRKLNAAAKKNFPGASQASPRASDANQSHTNKQTIHAGENFNGVKP